MAFPCLAFFSQKTFADDSFFLSLLLRRRKVDFKSERENDDDSFLSKQLDAMNSVTSKELPKVNKSCTKVISLEK